MYPGAAWFRKNIHELYFAAPVAMLLRTGCTDCLGYFLLMGFFGSGPESRATEFNFKTSTWSSQLKDLGLKEDFLGQIIALIVMLVKIAFFHLSQPLAMIAAFYAYGPFMGWVQWSCGFLVCFREAMYLAIILLTCCVAPHVFLFVPLTEKRSSVSLLFFASPQVFLALSLGHRGYEVLDVLTYLGSLFFDSCALLAFLAGTLGGFGWGTMWPALAISYMLAFVSVPVNLHQGSVAGDYDKFLRLG